MPKATATRAVPKPQLKTEAPIKRKRPNPRQGKIVMTLTPRQVSVHIIGLKPYVATQLDEHGVCTLEDLLSCSKQDLLAMRWFGYVRLNDVLRVLKDLKLNLAP